MADPLDDLIADHYRAVAAPTAVRERLVALALDRASQRRRLRLYTAGGLAAAALLAALAWWPPGRPGHAGPAEIASSVALYHLHRKPNEVVAARIEDVAQGLPRLDFALRLPARDGLPDWRLEGGRYCSLGGNIAAQLALSDVHGGRHTVYVARSAGAVAEIASFNTAVDGVAVRIWREDGLAFAWVSDAMR
jgi:hypothetical protein